MSRLSKDVKGQATIRQSSFLVQSRRLLLTIVVLAFSSIVVDRICQILGRGRLFLFRVGDRGTVMGRSNGGQKPYMARDIDGHS